MKKLFTESEFLFAKSKEKLPCECYTCKSTFYLTKHNIQKGLNPNQLSKGKYCSISCNPENQRNRIKVACKLCLKEFEKLPKEFKKAPNHFCSRSCAITYNNTHKTHGTRRSKLEVWLEEQLTLIYPNLAIDFNKKDAIDSELDIYIPSLKLAFELNGIYHYEPIHGQNKLNQVQNNDNRKFQACAEKEISLCIIDTSLQKYVKPKTSQKFLDIIINIINSKN